MCLNLNFKIQTLYEVQVFHSVKERDKIPGLVHSVLSCSQINKQTNRNSSLSGIIIQFDYMIMIFKQHILLIILSVPFLTMCWEQIEVSNTGFILLLLSRLFNPMFWNYMSQNIKNKTYIVFTNKHLWFPLS